MYSDSHLHSSFSSDSDTPMEEMIQTAISKRLSSMCFTEHQDLDFPPGEFDFLVDMDAYQQTLSTLAKKYQEQIHIRFGIELGLQPQLGNRLSDFVNSYPFDFVIGSVHVVDRLDPYESVFYENRSEKEAYLRYFTCLLENVKKYSCFARILGNEAVITAVNNDANPVHMEINCPVSASGAQEALTGTGAELRDGRIIWEMPAYGSAIFVIC